MPEPPGFRSFKKGVLLSLTKAGVEKLAASPLAGVQTLTIMVAV